MRCWVCDNLILVPSADNPFKGIIPTKTIKTSILCGRCGATYVQTTELVGQRARIPAEDTVNEAH